MGYFDKFQSKGIPFMEGRDKADMKDIVGEFVHIEDFGFIRNDDGDYGVIALKEHPGVFYFCNQVITDMLHTVQEDGMRGELPNQGIVFTLAKSKKGREYFKFDFCDSADDIPF